MVFAWTSAPAAAAAAAGPVPAPVVPGGRTSLVPLSARERKQVYTQSAIFDPSGPSPQSRYTAAWQTNAVSEMRQQRASITPRGPSAAHMPSPADLKATANSGHSVITWGASQGAASTPQFVKWSEGGDTIQVVHARKESNPLPRGEFTKMEWSDSRCEMARGHGKDAQDKSAVADAGLRKRQELASEVFGASRRTERSTTQPSREIRPVTFYDINNTDSVIDKAAPQEPNRSPEQQKQPLSARERRTASLDASRSSQFAAYPSSKKEGAAGPRSPRASAPGVGVGEASERRRAERNYSDLFGAPSPRKATAGEAASPSPKTAGSALPAGGGKEEGEVIYRPHLSALGSRTSKDPGDDRVLPATPRMRPNYAANAEEKKVLNEERACWDTRVSMNSGAEVARRHRERLQGQDSDQEASLRSPTQRKRTELGSRGLRSGIGAKPLPHEDAGAALARAPAVDASPSSRSLGGSYRSLHAAQPTPQRPDSARSRKMTELMSSVVF